jgi:transposase
MSAEVFVGLDVSRTAIQISVRPSGENWNSALDDNGIAATAEKLRDIHPDLVVMEAHGGPELPLAGTLATAGLPFAMVSPRNIREFAKAIGGTRQDRNQAGLLAHYAELVRPEVRKVSPELVQQLQALRSRRLELLSMLALEQRRLDSASTTIQRDLRNHIHFLEKSVALIDEDISRSVRANGRLFIA